MDRRHTITDADMERMQSEIIDQVVASGNGRDGRKRIVMRVRYDNTLSWIVIDSAGIIVPYVHFTDAVDAYNDL